MADKQDDVDETAADDMEVNAKLFEFQAREYADIGGVWAWGDETFQLVPFLTFGDAVTYISAAERMTTKPATAMRESIKMLKLAHTPESWKRLSKMVTSLPTAEVMALVEKILPEVLGRPLELSDDSSD